MWHEIHAPKTPQETAWSTQKLNELQWRCCSASSSTSGDGCRSTQQRQGGFTGKHQKRRTPVYLLYGSSGCGKLSAVQATLQHNKACRVKVFYAAEHTVEELQEFLTSAAASYRCGPSAATREKKMKKQEETGCSEMVSASSKRPVPARQQKTQAGAKRLASLAPVAETKLESQQDSTRLRDPARMNFIQLDEEDAETQESKTGAAATHRKQQPTRGDADVVVVASDDDSDASTCDGEDATARSTQASTSAAERSKQASQQQRPNAAKACIGSGEYTTRHVAETTRGDDNDVDDAVPVCFVVKELPVISTDRRKRELHSVFHNFVLTVERIASEKSQQQHIPIEESSPPCCIVLHTIHDTHSEKVDLYKFLPSFFFNSPAVSMFHCTPITTRNCASRLRKICEEEAASSRRVPASRSSTLTQVPPLHVLEQIAASANGDMRQALLQLQWHCLIYRSAEDWQRRTVSSSSLQAEQQALDACRGLIATRSGNATLGLTQVSPTPTPGSATSKRGRVEGKKEPATSQLTSVDSAVDFFASQFPPELLSGSATAAKQDDVSGKRNANKKRRGEKGPTVPSNDGQRSTQQEGGTEASPTQSQVAFRRDDYIDVGHGAARILTRKYTADSVLDVVPVPPSKLFSYVWNNMPSYFSQNRIAAAAECLDAASTCDAGLRHAEHSAFSVFVSAYRFSNAEPDIPRTFLSHAAPAFMPPPFPIDYTPTDDSAPHNSRWGGRSGNGGTWFENRYDSSCFRDMREAWHIGARATCNDGLAEETLPLCCRVCLELPGAGAATSAAPSNSFSQQGLGVSASRGGGTAHSAFPKRTIFRPQALKRAISQQQFDVAVAYSDKISRMRQLSAPSFAGFTQFPSAATSQQQHTSQLNTEQFRIDDAQASSNSALLLQQNRDSCADADPIGDFDDDW